MQRKKSKLYDLNEKAFQILLKCKRKQTGTIPFPQVYSRICTHFSINKEEARALFDRFYEEGRIVFIGFLGVRIISQESQ